MRIRSEAGGWSLDPAEEMERMVARWREGHPGKKPIRLDRGEATQPVGLAGVAAMQTAVAQLGCKGTVPGGSPAQGYQFLREAACRAYAELGVALAPEELVVTAGVRDGIAGIFGLMEPGWTGLAADPGLWALDRLAARSGGRVIRLAAGPERAFLPMPEEASEEVRPDLIFLCSPGDPTGAAYRPEQLTQWVRYARERGALLVFDASYEAFAQEGAARSVYGVEGARECAAELRSFAAADGFGCAPCGLLAAPAELAPAGQPLSVRLAAARAEAGGAVAYPVQRGAEAALSAAGRAQAAAQVREYHANAGRLLEGLRALGLAVYGGVHAPYLWLRCPAGITGRTLAARFLEEEGVSVLPGDVFGAGGADWVRLSGYCDRAAIPIALRRLEALLAHI